MRIGNKSGNSKRKRKSGKPKESIQLEKWRNQNDSIMKTRTRGKNDQLRSAECTQGHWRRMWDGRPLTQQYAYTFPHCQKCFTYTRLFCNYIRTDARLLLRLREVRRLPPRLMLLGVGGPFGGHWGLWKAGWLKQGVRKTMRVRESFLPRATTKPVFLKSVQTSPSETTWYEKVKEREL